MNGDAGRKPGNAILYGRGKTTDGKLHIRRSEKRSAAQRRTRAGKQEKNEIGWELVEKEAGHVCLDNHQMGVEKERISPESSSSSEGRKRKNEIRTLCKKTCLLRNNAVGGAAWREGDSIIASPIVKGSASNWSLRRQLKDL